MSSQNRTPRASWRATASLGTALLFSAVAALSMPSCLERRDDGERVSDATRCATCHGDPTRTGDFLLRSAPPRDVSGDSETSYPGVGAHLIHLQAAQTHGPIACGECHVVPTETESPGHADDARPAELVFGELAKTGGRSPSYDFATRKCSDSYCHGEADAAWTKPRSSEDACGTCHGLPPPAPHPASTQCSSCHGTVIDAAGKIIAPELHVNGTVDVELGGCSDCHGSDKNPAPPRDTVGNTETSFIGVGAHQVHLAGGVSGRPLQCQECHTVPAKVDDPGHADALPAEVLLLGVATTSGRTPLWERTAGSCSASWCHSPSPVSVQASPSWTTAGPLGCTGCHGAPPPAPHPQSTDCSLCHGEIVAADDVTILDRARHVDGIVDMNAKTECNACHGSTNPAPPVDLQGNTATTAPGVGAHQVHLAGSNKFRAVLCSDCHKVPTQWLESGHLDSAGPAELIFSGAAVAGGSVPSYANGTCTNTWCHNPGGAVSGGLLTAPKWTQVDGTQSNCGTCHGLPPLPPHPDKATNPTCNTCHKNISTDNFTFLKPELHADGIVTFALP
ncbi:MAG TPA: CxxxxCH/CxxCH domain-containing protein [Polyangiaceae bacterium]|nr:CxxxxCH/CxxCH domain-containing protein [Polyangiaceae bacterium]